MPPSRRTSVPGFAVSTAAFSLIEVTLAIAVLATVVVGMMALMPSGMARFQAAMDITLSSQIAQRVITDAEQAEFDKLTAKTEAGDSDFYVLPKRYFDADGTEIVPKAATLSETEKTRLVYVVRVRGSLPGPSDISAGGGAFTSLPADTGSPRYRMRASSILTVQVVQNPSLRDLPVGPDLLWPKNSAPMNIFTAVITRSSFARTKPTP
jgi:uncharacterized protein (TIGR02598 family)